MTKSGLLLLATACFLLSSCGRGASKAGAARVPTLVADELIVAATDFQAHLVADEWEPAAAVFNAEMAKALPMDKLAEAWAATERSMGAFRELEKAERRFEKGMDVVILTCRFDKAQADVRVVFDTEKRIAGFWIGPPARVADDWRPPSYAKSARFEEQELTIGSGEWELPATLTLPKGAQRVPALVLVHGSGPNDRDETIGPNKVFRDLAWGLASRGIAVLRYEKRTLRHQGRMAALAPSLTVRDETVEDAVLAIEALSRNAAVDPERVYLLGHSLGGMLVPRIAAASGAAAVGLRGCVLFAAPARPLQELVAEQLEYIASLDAVPNPDLTRMIESARADAAVIAGPELDSLPADAALLGAYPAYWLDLRGYHPARETALIRKPLLVMQGGRDYQVTLRDFDAYKAALSGMPGASFKLYADLNHLFMAGKGKSSPAEYETAGHVAREVVEDIAAWIQDAER